jgi:hypothetical protein
MHPLQDNLKIISFEELEKRKAEINRRMQIMRRTQWHNPEIWNQLELMMESVHQEQQERYLQMNSQSSKNNNSGTVLSTDPLPEDQIPDTQKTVGRQFRPVQ